MGSKRLILHRKTMKKINIALCVIIAILVVTLMFLLMKRKEAIMQTDNARLTYEDAKTKYSYEGLVKQETELQQQLDKLNSDISYRNDEINDFNDMISKAEARENAADRFNDLAEMYLKLLNDGQ